MLGIGQSYGLRVVVLGVVRLLRSLVAIAAIESARGGGHWTLWLRRAVCADEELVVLAGGYAVAPVELLQVPIARGRSVGGIAVVSAWRAAIVGILILAGRAHIRVWDVGIVVVLAVSVVRHGDRKARRWLGRRDGCGCGGKRHSRGYLTKLRGHHDQGR